MIVTRDDGSRWRLGAPVRTSDGFLLATGIMIDDNDDDVLDDDSGFAVVHSFFLGRAAA